MKSECPQIRRLLSEYIDGTLDSAWMNSVMEHLHNCEGCRHEYNVLGSLVRKLGDLSTVRAPDNFLEKFHERIRSDSIFDRIRGCLSPARIRIPVEMAAFATTAVLILFFFSLFPAEEKNIIKVPGNNSMLAMDEGTLPAQNILEPYPEEKPSKDISSAGQVKIKQMPVRLSLLLTTQQETITIPSQSVSFGTQGAGYLDDYPDVWQSETGNDSATRLIQPDEVNQRIDEIIKSVGGNVISRGSDSETGYPNNLTLDIPADNYSRFISGIEVLGALKSAAPALPEGSEGAEVLIQMELTRQE